MIVIIIIIFIVIVNNTICLDNETRLLQRQCFAAKETPLLQRM
jgi:hypothetical protein